MLKEAKAWRGVGIVCAAALACSLAPLFLIGLYAHPCADDFSYGAPAALAWSASGSFLEVLESAARNTIQVYHTWQGSFAAVFLMSLQPAVFGEGMYFWGVLFLLLSYLVGSLFFLKVFLRNYAGLDRTSFCIVSSLLLLVAVQYRYSLVEGFYWFNGGIYYTFFYAAALVLLGLCLLLLKESKKTLFTCYLVLSCPLAFLVGGGNYTTALTVLLLLFFCLLVLLLRKNKKAVWIGVVLLFLLLSFFLSVLAPGNAIRQESAGSPNAVKAIILSFVYGAYSIFNATTVPVIILWIFLLPILFHAAKKSAFSFRRPLVMLGLSFCIYCAQATPPFYALGFSLPERLINIIYDSYYLFMLFSLYYLCGWAARKCQASPVWQQFLEQASGFLRRHIWPSFLTVCAVFICACVGLCAVSKGENGLPAIQRLPASAQAVISLLDGEAERYSKALTVRESLYHDPSKKEILAEPLRDKPLLLYSNDITEDASDWRNQAVARYYQKESIRLRPEPDVPKSK